MNFLAHAFLSGDDPLIRTGNFVADSVKGSKHSEYPALMQKGILLHRFIDHYTDTHPIVDESKKVLRERFGKYAGVVADVFYDHYLARHWHEHHPSLSLREYADETYSILTTNFELLPERSRQFIPFLIEQDWLGSYASREGISEILVRMSRRTGFDSGMQRAKEELNERDYVYKNHFDAFFPELQKATRIQLDRLLNGE